MCVDASISSCIAQSVPLRRVPKRCVSACGAATVARRAPSGTEGLLVMRMPTLPMRSLQARILAPFILVVVLVQVGGYLLINTVGGAAARRSVGAEVVAGARVFDRFLEQDTERLVQSARLLTADYAFRETVATRDRGTIASVLANHGKRIDAAMMLLVDLDRQVLADTLRQPRDRPALCLPRTARPCRRRAAGVRDGRAARRALPARDRARARTAAGRVARGRVSRRRHARARPSPAHSIAGLVPGPCAGRFVACAGEHAVGGRALGAGARHDCPPVHGQRPQRQRRRQRRGGDACAGSVDARR